MVSFCQNPYTMSSLKCSSMVSSTLVSQIYNQVRVNKLFKAIVKFGQLKYFTIIWQKSNIFLLKTNSKLFVFDFGNDLHAVNIVRKISLRKICCLWRRRTIYFIWKALEIQKKLFLALNWTPPPIPSEVWSHDKTRRWSAVPPECGS